MVLQVTAACFTAWCGESQDFFNPIQVYSLHCSPGIDGLRAARARGRIGLASVPGFAVRNRLGRMQTQDPVDLRDVRSLDSIFSFLPRSVSVYGPGTDGSYPPAGYGRNTDARNTLLLWVTVLDQTFRDIVPHVLDLLHIPRPSARAAQLSCCPSSADKL